MIRAIIFDIGGVLINVDVEHDKQVYRDVLGYDKIDEILDASHQKGVYSDFEEGKISDDDFRQYILKDSKPGSRPEDVDRCMSELLRGMPVQKAELLTELSKDYDIFFLSNNNGISMKYCHKAMEEAGLDVAKVIKKEFLSYQMKMLKPGLEIYRKVVEEVGLPAGDILFLDDAVANVNAASQVGITAVHYKPGEDLRAVVNKALEDNR